MLSPPTLKPGCPTAVDYYIVGGLSIDRGLVLPLLGGLE